MLLISNGWFDFSLTIFKGKDWLAVNLNNNVFNLSWSDPPVLNVNSVVSTAEG